VLAGASGVSRPSGLWFTEVAPQPENVA
jgi:hypothetical protein